MGYVDGTSALEMLDNIFEVIEGGKSVEAAKVTELIADNGAKICDITSYTTNAANGAAAEVAEVVNIEAGAAAGTTTGAGILAMDVGAAGAAIAPALGVLAGVGLYNLAPEFWTNVSNRLMEAGATVKGKVLGFIDAQGKTSFPKNSIEIFKEALLQAGVFSNGYTPKDSAELEHPERFNLPILNTELPAEYKMAGDSTTEYCYTNSQYDAAFAFRSIETENPRGGMFVLICSLTNSSIDLIRHYTDGGGHTYDLNEGTNSLTLSDGRTVYYSWNNLWPKVESTIAGIWNFYNGDSSTKPVLKDLLDIYYNGDYSTNVQDSATLPEPGVEFPQTYPDWKPAQFPEPLPQEIPEPYPIALPEPDSVQDPAQSGENQNEAQQDQLLNIFYNTLPDPRPHVLPDVDPSLNPEPEPAPQPEPQPNPTDPNPEPPPSDPTIGLPVLDTTSASRMFTVYNPTDAQVNSLGAFLWNSNIIEQIKKLWENPMDGIISFHKIYGAPVTGSTKNIVLGYIDSGVSALEVTSQFTQIDCGTVRVPERLHNATDYSPFTALHVYLPFIGIVELDTDECMNADLHIVYRIDVYTGTCVALIYAKRDADMPQEQIIYTFSGNASQKLPLTAADFSGAIGALLGLAGAGVAVASGGSLGVAAGALGAAHSLTSEMVHIQHSGGLSANAGILSPRVPYLILSRQYGYDANGYSGFYGYPANKTVYIGNCNGYIKCKDVIFRGSCTEEEAEEIVSLLKDGVYV